MRLIYLLLFCLFTAQSFGATTAPKSEPFTYEKLVDLIKTKDLKSVDAVLPLLPEEMRSNFTLVHTSSSLQKSSYMYPRAILFGKGGRLTCTFGGSPELEGYDSLECYQFRSKEAKFDFREITFPTPENKLNQVAFSESNRRAIGRQTCTSCHTRDPKPIWEQYQNWPSAYGSEDDSYSSEYLERGGAPLSNELKNFLKFKTEVSRTGRYRSLNFGPNLLSPYSDKVKGSNYYERPNLRFLFAAADLTARRNARIILDHSLKSAYRFVYNLMTCKSDNPNDVLKDISPIFTPVEWSPAFLGFTPELDNYASDYTFRTGVTRIYFEDIVGHYISRELVNRKALPARFLEDLEFPPEGFSSLIRSDMYGPMTSLALDLDPKQSYQCRVLRRYL